MGTPMLLIRCVACYSFSSFERSFLYVYEFFLFMCLLLAFINSSLKACPESDQMTLGLVSFVSFPSGFILDRSGIVEQDFLEY